MFAIEEFGGCHRRVESYIGFIETYADPRAEWEGPSLLFTHTCCLGTICSLYCQASRQLSAQYGAPASKAPELINVLHWGPDFELTVHQTQFLWVTFHLYILSLVLTSVNEFATGSIPVGINVRRFSSQTRAFIDPFPAAYLTPSWKRIANSRTSVPANFFSYWLRMYRQAYDSS